MERSASAYLRAEELYELVALADGLGRVREELAHHAFLLVRRKHDAAVGVGRIGAPASPPAGRGRASTQKSNAPSTPEISSTPANTFRGLASHPSLDSTPSRRSLRSVQPESL